MINIIPKNLAPVSREALNAMLAAIFASVSIGNAGPWFSKCDPRAIIPTLKCEKICESIMANFDAAVMKRVDDLLSTNTAETEGAGSLSYKNWSA